MQKHVFLPARSKFSRLMSFVSLLFHQDTFLKITSFLSITYCTNFLATTKVSFYFNLVLFSIQKTPILNLFTLQVKLWSNLEKLLTCKKQCLEQARDQPELGTVHIEPGTETLVLQ